MFDLKIRSNKEWKKGNPQTIPNSGVCTTLPKWKIMGISVIDIKNDPLNLTNGIAATVSITFYDGHIMPQK